MEALTDNPITHNVALMFFHLGHGFEIEGQYEDAIHHYMLALKKEPDFQLARTHLNQLLQTPEAH
jgi:hypothetical protein